MKTKTPKTTAVKAKAPAQVPPKAAVKAAPAQKAAKKPVKAVQKKAAATFSYRAEKGCTVFLAGNFNDWNETAIEMIDENGTGVYTVTLTLATGSYEYKFVIDGAWCADPECADWVQNNHGTLNSVKHVNA